MAIGRNATLLGETREEEKKDRYGHSQVLQSVAADSEEAISSRAPQSHQKIRESIQAAMQNALSAGVQQKREESVSMLR